MTGRLTSLCMLLTFLCPASAQAQQTIDVAKITCDQFMFGRIADSRTISLWLFGYYDGSQKNTILDVASMQKSSEDLVRYCMDHSNALVMDAAKSVLGTAK